MVLLTTGITIATTIIAINQDQEPGDNSTNTVGHTAYVDIPARPVKHHPPITNEMQRIRTKRAVATRA